MQLTRGVWQMSLAMIISGSIGAFVLLWFAGDRCGVLALPDWRANPAGVYRVKPPAASTG